MALLVHSEDRRSVGLLMALFAVFGVMWMVPSWRFALLLPACVLVFVATIIKHNHMHTATFRLPVANRVFQVLLGLATGTTSTGIITAHNVRHHGDNQSEQDFVRASLVHFRSNIWNVLAFPPVSVWTMVRNKPSDLPRWRATKPALYRQAVVERGVNIAFCVVVLAVDWRAALVVFAVPWVFGQWCLIAVNHLQHQGCDAHSEVACARTITGRVTNWFLLNNGYHLAHHAKPALHWSQLPALHAELLPGTDTSLSHRSLGGAIVAHLRRSP